MISDRKISTKCVVSFPSVDSKLTIALQIQVPKGTKVPKDWTAMSTTKDLDRYYSPAVAKLVQELKEARERQTTVVNDFALEVRHAPPSSSLGTDCCVHRSTRSTTRITRLGCRLSRLLLSSIVYSRSPRVPPRSASLVFGRRSSNRILPLSNSTSCDTLAF